MGSTVRDIIIFVFLIKKRNNKLIENQIFNIGMKMEFFFASEHKQNYNRLSDDDGYNK